MDARELTVQAAMDWASKNIPEMWEVCIRALREDEPVIFLYGPGGHVHERGKFDEVAHETIVDFVHIARHYCGLPDASS